MAEPLSCVFDTGWFAIRLHHFASFGMAHVSNWRFATGNIVLES